VPNRVWADAFRNRDGQDSAATLTCLRNIEWIPSLVISTTGNSTQNTKA
jgi:hypothetical protein